MKGQSIKKNYFLNTAYQILVLITPLITAPYVSRVVGANGVGIYSYTASVVALFTLLACLGTTTYGQRAIAQSRDDTYARSKTFWEIEILAVLTTIICCLFWVGFIAVSQEYKLYFCILSLDLISVALDISWFYSGMEQFSHIVYRNFVVKICGIALIFLLVKSRNDLAIYISILSITKVMGNLSMWLSMPKYVVKIPFKELKILPHFKETMAYFIPTAASAIYTYVDKIMIGAFTNTAVENGFYEQANKIINMAYSVVISMNTVMSARMSYLFSNRNEEEIRSKLGKALAFILTLAIPLTFGIAGVAYNFVPWFFGEGYDKVAKLMIIASPLVVILSLHNFLSAQYLVPSGQRVRSTKGVLLGAGVNFACNLILIPRLQSMGAVIATLIGETAICCVYFYMSKEYVPVSLFLKYIPKQVCSALVMLLIVTLIGRGHQGDILITLCQVAAGAFVYALMLYMLKEQFFRECLQRFGEMLKRIIRK